MILCICQSVSDREVDAAIRDGARSVADVSRACGAARDCGCCRQAIEQRIHRGCESACADCPRLTPELASAAL
jgi:bacterioferritin-associated ferredoxin